MLTAEFYAGRKGQPATLDFNVIANGERTPISSILVADKREARKAAAARGAKCWNF